MLSLIDRWLLAAVSPDAFPLPAELDASVIVGRELARAASRNRVGPFLWTLCERPEVRARLDDGARAKVRASLADTLLLGLRLQKEIRSVGQILDEAGLRALIYKGADIDQRCYERSCPRLFGDLDLALRHTDVDGAIEALVRAGYRLVPEDGPPLAYFRRHHLHATFAHDERILPVEIHWALRSPYDDDDGSLPDPIPGLFERAEPDGTFGPGIVRPSPVDALALLVGHAEKHLSLCAFLPTRAARAKAVIEAGGLVWVLDLVRWLGRERSEGAEPLEEAELRRRLEELGGRDSLPVALRLVADLAPDSLPGWAAEEAARLPPARTPRIARFAHPAASAGRGRAFLLEPLPRLGFRPLLLLAALLPRAKVPGTSPRPFRRRLGRAVRWWKLALAHAWALLLWRLRGR